MKKFLIPVAVAATAVMATVAAYPKNDPVLMTIDGKDVRLSEFLYLYNKNNKQQQDSISVDDYLNMFVDYKLKVADAEAAGLDTTASFIKEYTTYCNENAAPFLLDPAIEAKMADSIYSRMTRNVDVSHILLPPARNAADREATLQRLDSIRTAILNGADWGELAVKYSIDPSARENKGNIGFITANMWPYEFEKVAFSTPVGEISQPFADGNYGFHILKVNAERPDPGEVRAAHILLLTIPGESKSDSIAAARIDSLYNEAVSGADFADLARRFSQDPGSASQGGDLGYFGPGRMVKPFENAAYSLADNEISRPFKTQYGYHIVKRLGAKNLGSAEQESARIKEIIARDAERAAVLNNVRREANRVKYKAVIDTKGCDKIRDIIISHDGVDSAVIADIKKANILIGTVNKGKIKVTSADLVDILPPVRGKITLDNSLPTIERAMYRAVDNAVDDFARENLARDNAEYRNLMKEYRDGILLFDISDREVWGRSSKDKEGLDRFFNENRDKYTWDKQHFKGYIVMAINDSVAGVVKQYLNDNNVATDSLVRVLREKFGRDAAANKVVAAKGDNAIIDYVIFGEKRPAEADRSRMRAWFPYHGRMIDKPEEATDVRAAVTADYQKWLEEKWLEKLRAGHKVVIKKKVLDKIK